VPKLIEGQPNEYGVICRNAVVLAFHLWPTIFAGTAFQRVPKPLHPWRVPADGVGEPATEQGADDAARYEESGGERPEHRERFRRHVASIALSISLVEEVHDQLQSVHRQTDTHTT